MILAQQGTGGRRRLALCLALPCLVAVLLMTFQVCASLAATLYVSPLGDDAAPGTASRPFLTISRAVARARAGDVVNVGPGTYGEIVRIGHSGKKGKPIIVQSTEPFGAVIDGSGTAADTDLVQITGNHVRFSGFRVQNARRSGISAWATSNVTIAGNSIVGSARAGIWLGQTRPGRSAANVIEANVVIGNCRENSGRHWRSGWPRAISADFSDNVTIRRNLVFQNYGEGIGILSAHGALIDRNVVFDNFSVNIYLDNAPQSTVTDNLAFTTGDHRFFRRGQPAKGVVIANEDTAYPYPSSGIRVIRNVLVGVGDVTYGDYGLGGGLVDSVIGPNRVLHAMRMSDLSRLAQQRIGRRLDLPIR